MTTKTEVFNTTRTALN